MYRGNTGSVLIGHIHIQLCCGTVCLYFAQMRSPSIGRLHPKKLEKHKNNLDNKINKTPSIRPIALAQVAGEKNSFGSGYYGFTTLYSAVLSLYLPVAKTAISGGIPQSGGWNPRNSTGQCWLERFLPC